MSLPSRQREGVVAVIQQDATFLVIRRSRHVVAPGKLCFPGGGIEVGESQEEALCRELIEELSVKVVPQTKLWESETRAQTRIHWWSAVISEGEALQANPKEVASIYWMTKDDLLKHADLLEGNRAFLDRD
ncbi:MAG: NUDIX domain-containing protein [Pirellulales bacterium]|nr:NUDIX domain-containing protein [Pirellulales bacterium]